MDIPEIEKIYIPSRCIHCMKIIDDASYSVFGHGGLQQPQKVCCDCCNNHWKECNNCHKHIPVDCTVCPCCNPDGSTIAIPQYKASSHSWDKLFNEVTKALTRGGEQEDTFPKLAPKWNCSEEECALRMAEMKIARIESGKEKEDSYVDAIGYLVLAWQKYCKEETK